MSDEIPTTREELEAFSRDLGETIEAAQSSLDHAPAVACTDLLGQDFVIPWGALRAAREELAARAQTVRCAAVNCEHPEDKAMAVQSAEAMEGAVARLEKFERELPGMIRPNDQAHA